MTAKRGRVWLVALLMVAMLATGWSAEAKKPRENPVPSSTKSTANRDEPYKITDSFYDDHAWKYVWKCAHDWNWYYDVNSFTIQSCTLMFVENPAREIPEKVAPQKNPDPVPEKKESDSPPPQVKNALLDEAMDSIIRYSYENSRVILIVILLLIVNYVILGAVVMSILRKAKATTLSTDDLVQKPVDKRIALPSHEFEQLRNVIEKLSKQSDNIITAINVLNDKINPLVRANAARTAAARNNKAIAAEAPAEPEKKNAPEIPQWNERNFTDDYNAGFLDEDRFFTKFIAKYNPVPFIASEGAELISSQEELNRARFWGIGFSDQQGLPYWWIVLGPYYVYNKMGVFAEGPDGAKRHIGNFYDVEVRNTGHTQIRMNKPAQGNIKYGECVIVERKGLFLMPA